MLHATHWAGLLFVSNCLFVFLKYMPAIWEGVLVCISSKYLHMHTCIPPMEDCLFFLKYMPGAPCHQVTCFCLFVCLCFLEVHVSHPWRICCVLCSCHFSRRYTCSKLCVDSPQPYSLLTLANNTCFRHTLTDIRERFNKLYRRKVSTWWECEGVWCEVCVRDGSVRNGSVRVCGVRCV